MSKPLFCSVLFSILLAANVGNAALKVIMLDVGNGQSILLVENNHGVLIDTGLPSSTDHVNQRMDWFGVKQLDYLLLSHLHPDHAGGYPQLRDTWPETPVFDDCHISPSLHPDEEIFFVRTSQKLLNDPLRNCLQAGDSLSWQGHKLTILWPEQLQSTTDLNAHSLVILLTSGQGATVLLMGDVNQEVERYLLPILRPLLNDSAVDIYMAGHHGAIDTGAPEFLQMLRPKVSLISVGKGNTSDYPAAKTIRLLSKYSGTVLRTDQNGEICFQAKGSAFVPCESPTKKQKSEPAHKKSNVI